MHGTLLLFYCSTLFMMISDLFLTFRANLMEFLPLFGSVVHSCTYTNKILGLTLFMSTLDRFLRYFSVIS